MTNQRALHSIVLGRIRTGKFPTEESYKNDPCKYFESITHSKKVHLFCF